MINCIVVSSDLRLNVLDTCTVDHQGAGESSGQIWETQTGCEGEVGKSPVHLDSNQTSTGNVLVSLGIYN